MPLQNRVDPLGQLQRLSARGQYTGNRGVIHNHDRQIIKNHTTKRWIYCLLNFKDRYRKVMTPGRYTELFFLDEATALAAGHRPCAECQRAKYNRFVTTWRAANNAQSWKLNEIDAYLHNERMHRTFDSVNPASVPNGVIARKGSDYYLKSDDLLKKWSFFGYEQEFLIAGFDQMELITPLSIVKTLESGFTWE